MVEYLLQRSDVQVDLRIATRRERFAQLREAISEPTAGAGGVGRIGPAAQGGEQVLGGILEDQRLRDGAAERGPGGVRGGRCPASE